MVNCLASVMDGPVLCPVAALVLGIVLSVSAFRRRDRLRKYEFQNRSGGGTVSFPSYEASKRHSRAKVMARLQGSLGWVLVVLGLIGFALAALIAHSPRPK